MYISTEKHIDDAFLTLENGIGITGLDKQYLSPRPVGSNYRLGGGGGGHTLQIGGAHIIFLIFF